MVVICGSAIVTVFSTSQSTAESGEAFVWDWHFIIFFMTNKIALIPVYGNFA